MHEGSSDTAFRLIEKQLGPELTTRESGVRLTQGPILHAVDPMGRRHLLVPIGDEPGVKDDGSRGLSVATRSLPDLHERVVDIRCDDQSLNDLFAVLCDEIIDDVKRLPEPHGLASMTVIDRWRDLLGPRSSRLLGVSEVKGLLAELHVLERLATLEARRAFEVWTGPDRSRSDFTGVQAVLEVKASTLVDEIRVHVNGLSQLDPPPGKQMYLLVERLERVPVGGDTLAAAARRLLTLGIPTRDLYASLRRIGVDPTDLAAYEHLRFDTRQLRMYLVNDAFPRLTPSSLQGKAAQDRIVQVEYVIDLGAQPPSPVTDAESAVVLQTLLQS